MMYTEAEHDEQRILFVPDLKHGTVLAVTLLAGLLAAMALVAWVQRTVHPYHPLVFEEAAREALGQGRFQRALTICTGNLNYTGQRHHTHGTAYMLRAHAYAGLMKHAEAAEDLARAEAHWRVSWRGLEAERRELKLLATELGMDALGAGDVEQAFRLFSLAGTGSGEPLAYIRGLRGMLTDEMAAAIWPDEPYLIIEDFERPGSEALTSWVEAEGRIVDMARVHSQASSGGPSSSAARISAGSVAETERTWYRMPFFMHIPEDPVRVRAIVQTRRGPPPGIILRHFYPLLRVYNTTNSLEAVLLAQDRYVIEAELSGGMHDDIPGCLIQIGVALPTEECEFLVERIELLPGREEEGRDEEGGGHGEG